MNHVVGYHRPASLTEAVHLLAPADRADDRADDRVALAGGVHLHHVGGANPAELVDLQAVGLDSIEIDTTTARFGAMVRLQALVDESGLPRVISQAASAEQPSTLRTLATVGGALATASGDSLLLAALLAHEAVVRLVCEQHGERTLPIGELFADGRRPGELIVDVTIQTAGKSAIACTGRTPRDTPIVGVVGRSGAGSGDTTLLGLCGVSATPVLLEPDRLGSLRPIDDHRATASYRSHLAEVLAARVLEQIS